MRRTLPELVRIQDQPYPHLTIPVISPGISRI